MTWGDEILDPGLRQEQQCVSVKPVNGILLWSFDFQWQYKYIYKKNDLIGVAFTKYNDIE